MFPYAHSLYSNQYSFLIEKSGLEQLKRSEYHSHTTGMTEKLHRLSEAVLLPARWSAQLLGCVIQPLAGESKDRPLVGLAYRIAAFALLVIVLPFAAMSLLVGFPLRFLDHMFRPAASYIDCSHEQTSKAKTCEELILSKENPLKIRTHNVGFVTSGMSKIGDLRPPAQRSREIVESILDDPLKPDMMFFQETFHEEATKILCNGIKQEYPYIVHSVAPHISGFSSGAMVASKFPIENVEFHRLNHILGPERASPRGIFKVRISSTQGTLLFYSVHTQALIGEDRAEARFKQLEDIQILMSQDAIKEPNMMQILLGDFNTSRVTAWGEDNLNPSGQAEEKVLKRFDEYFDDFYLRDHDPLTGNRVGKKEPFYLKTDNKRFGENLTEPSGSWYHGPFADPGFLLSTKMKLDRSKHGRPAPAKVSEIFVKKSTWGTPKWYGEQTANTARFDFICIPKRQQGQSKLKGRVEIRRIIVPKGTQSAASDHLPIDCRLRVIAD